MGVWSAFVKDKDNSDELLFFHTQMPEYCIVDPTLSLKVNTFGSFSFTAYPNNPAFEHLKKLNSIVTIYHNGVMYWKGRILEEVVGLKCEKKIICEGELSYLTDSIIRPADIAGNYTVRSYFERLISLHNAYTDVIQQFSIGNITISGSVIKENEDYYTSTWQLLNSDILNVYGGYIQLRYSGNTTYIDLLSDVTSVSNQPVELGLNLTDIKVERNADEIVTHIIPLGKTVQSTNQKLTISSLPNSTSGDICKYGDCIYSVSAYQQFHRITRVVEFDTDNVNTLLNLAKSYLQRITLFPEIITVKTVDLSAINNNFDCYKIGQKVSIYVSTHNVSANYNIQELNLKLLKPSANTITVGGNRYKKISEINIT